MKRSKKSIKAEKKIIEEILNSSKTEREIWDKLTKKNLKQYKKVLENLREA